MAHSYILERLANGVAAWNKWRQTSGYFTIDLSNISLINGNFDGIDLRDADIAGSDLTACSLRRANLLNARLNGANLSRATLTNATLDGAILDDCRATHANLSDMAMRPTPDDIARRGRIPSAKRAVLQNAILTRSLIERADLTDADLSGAHLAATVIDGCVLRGTNLRGAIFGQTRLANVDLSVANGIDQIEHSGPSIIDFTALRLSHGNLSSHFLRDCGLSDPEIIFAQLYDTSLSAGAVTDLLYDLDRKIGSMPIQISPVFISYSRSDSSFVERLEGEFRRRGIRYWRDVHDLTAGRLDRQIGDALRLNPTVLLVLSMASIHSDWVEWEAAEARKLEKELGRDVLCPLALDDAWETAAWSGPLAHQIRNYNVLNFSSWLDDRSFRVQAEKLMRGLKRYYS
ncbi:MAG TPA: toll/interleukin-1 receptor domain-containing protein [Thermoanaerobaculia bacterium]|nr:toll/interleukin-1 receptor domain-containing protein [Thermoanaerobaculia bacterium]